MLETVRTFYGPPIGMDALKVTRYFRVSGGLVCPFHIFCVCVKLKKKIHNLFQNFVLKILEYPWGFTPTLCETYCYSFNFIKIDIWWHLSNPSVILPKSSKRCENRKNLKFLDYIAHMKYFMKLKRKLSSSITKVCFIKCERQIYFSCCWSLR